jgi:molybdopterin/thiamine biosynthesis adenylyltransferase
MSEENVKRIVMVGAGGIGTWLAAGLVRMLEWKFPGSALIIVDGDNYEAKNLERQDFSQMGNKATVKALELTKQFRNTNIFGLPKWVVSDSEQSYDSDSSKIRAIDLITENDVVIAVVDNFAARKILFDAASKINNIDVFTGGNDDNLFGSVYHYQRRDGVDITAHPSTTHDEYMNPPDRNPGEMSCQERAEIEGGTQILATNMAVAAFILARIQKTIISNQSPEETEIYFDLGLGMSQPYNRMVEQQLITV